MHCAADDWLTAEVSEIGHTDNDPIQSNAKKRAQALLFARIFYNITH